MAKKPRIVIIGAGMAGLTAANKLYTSTSSNDLFELVVVEGGDRIGGRINTSEFCGDRIEMGATWIHGIGGSPVHQIAREIHALESDQPWECMDGFSDEPMTIAEGGFELNASIVDPISTLFNNLMDFAQGKLAQDGAAASKGCASDSVFGNQSVGAFLRQGLGAYWDSCKDHEELSGYGKRSRKLLEEAIFAMHENTQRTYTSAGDLFNLDFEAEREYRMFPREEITISKGYLSVIEHLASVLPPGVIQLGLKVTTIEWQPENHKSKEIQNGYDSSSRPVKLHFCDGSVMLADHVIITVSLGVLKAGTGQDSGMFNPPLPSFKTEAISRLGYGVVNKLFLQWSPNGNNRNANDKDKFPSLQIVFHPPESELRHEKIPVTMFLGSYSYVAVGSSGADLDTMAEPLPKTGSSELDRGVDHPLQILFAGEATHRTHYSTTHGAYFSGLREASRLLQHYHCHGV
ncbi:LOW QUALITY PROTEIN: probable polyamine oxidase 5 [Hibiscus syriacus]|uniref:LOW QUALITY PROTEIN: probable polyamine oxidase 5 n=1 Tax=Hibiscus syriacus TaxID=106335 RepID=UPI0019238090|nr:LOW QUALITY PROTEIN: probable polyamine oxidase 5 [Hibiscus syriacus]